MLPSDGMWLDIMCIAAAVALIEAALLGRGRTHGRGGRVSTWPIPTWNRPIFACAGFGLFAFGLIDVFRRLLR
jgi:hypothetical protein